MRYRKKPVEIDAIQFTGNNLDELKAFISDDVYLDSDDEGFVIQTLEGPMHASVDDYIIKGVKGEFYPCKPDIFNLTYDSIK